MSDLLRRMICRRYALVLTCLALLGGCNSIRLLPGADRTTIKDPPPAAPSKYGLRVEQFIFLSDFKVKRDQPLFDELAALSEQVTRELQLPSSTTVIQVYLFEDKEHYEKFMHWKHPELPNRRAFFIAQPRVNGTEELLVYTYWGNRVREDLRHELTHALLHSVLKGVPLWLDEGLAEYFELPPENKGVNYHHLGQFRRSDDKACKPNLIRLERLSQVDQMNPAEYCEAWAWVHLMLHARPEAKRVLLAYLQQLRTNPEPGPLQPRLAAVFPNLEEALDKHLEHLDAGRRPVPTSQQ